MRITLVAGLPGSGKSTLLGELAGQGAAVLDDIRSLAALPDPPPAHLAIADVNFCLPSVRTLALSHLQERYPGSDFVWIFFANDPDACIENADRRADGRNVRPDILALSARYEMPDGTEPLPVFRPGGPAPA